MRELWSYDKEKRTAKDGTRWHFASRHCFPDNGEDEPYELYFRDDERTQFGLLRFANRKDNPYRDYLTVITKIMNNAPFRTTLLKPETGAVWSKNWK